MTALTRGLLVLLAAAMAVTAFIAALAAVFIGIDAYMVASGRAKPGEPIFLDQLASPLGESLRGVAIAIAVIVLAGAARAFIERRLRPPSEPGAKGSR